MASNYEGFTVQARDANGVVTNVGAGVDVAVYDCTALSDVAESPLTTDINGEIASGSFAAVTAGTRIRFRIENEGGLSGSITQVTT